MKKILFLSVLTLISHNVQASAIEALKKYIPLYDHQGVNDAGRNCSIDFLRRPQGTILMELLAPQVVTFLISPDLPYEVGSGYYRVYQPSFEENDGIVTMGFILEGRTATVERRFCVGERCWFSRTSCHLDRW